MIKLTHFIFVAIFLSFSASAFSQTVTFESAKANYDAGNYQKALEDFAGLSNEENFKNDANVWNYLGLSYRALRKSGKSKDSFVKALTLAPNNIDIRFNYAVLLSELGNSDAKDELETVLKNEPDRLDALYMRASAYIGENKIDKANEDAKHMIQISPKSVSGYIILSKALEREMNIRIITERSSAKKEINYLRRSADSFESGIQACGNCPDLSVFQDQLGKTRKFLSLIEGPKADKSQAPQTKNKVNENSQFKIIKNQRPNYTDLARSKGIEGKVIVMAQFGASGKVENVIVYNALGYGLDVEAIKSAYGIKFRPEVENGRPVTIMKKVEYMFTIAQ
jgi:TonB family protein